MSWDKARTFKWLLLSVAVTVAGTFVLWWFFGGVAFFGFLFLPFVPILFGGGGRDEAVQMQACPECGFESLDPEDRYCPRDGALLR
ncbi:MAG: hypothetical protein KY455_07585 [Euryarchaeota archaeon]|nr:hypothetical protein [Euryarchaeota archaeon]